MLQARKRLQNADLSIPGCWQLLWNTVWGTRTLDTNPRDVFSGRDDALNTLDFTAGTRLLPELPYAAEYLRHAETGYRPKDKLALAIDKRCLDLPEYPSVEQLRAEWSAAIEAAREA